MVTDGRGTSDNDHTGAADLYPLGNSGLLMDAVGGIWSSRDNVFTSPHESNCPKGNCSDTPDYRLQNVAAVLAGGPYGPSDGIGHMNRALIMHSYRSGGLLLKPDVPLATLDAAFLGGNFNFNFDNGSGSRINPAHVWGTYSQIGSLRWSYIFPTGMSVDLTMTLQELDSTPALGYVLLDFWATNGRRPPASSINRVASASGSGSFVVPRSPPPFEQRQRQWHVPSFSTRSWEWVVLAWRSAEDCHCLYPAFQRHFGDGCNNCSYCDGRWRRRDASDAQRCVWRAGGCVGTASASQAGTG